MAEVMCSREEDQCGVARVEIMTRVSSKLGEGCRTWLYSAKVIWVGCDVIDLTGCCFVERAEDE